MNTKVFWLERTDLVRVSLRRFTYNSDKACPASNWGHDASIVIVDNALRDIWTEAVLNDGRVGYYGVRDGIVSRDDVRWPLTCQHCGEPFQLDDEFQINATDLYAGSPDGILCTLRDAPVGAMWNAWWLPEWYQGADGIALHVKTPGGDWHVDGEASNCTRPQREKRDDGHTYLTARTHFCWIRHGDPRAGNIHVDKDGDTCAAGAGSILIGDYHGFLHNGHLTSC